MKESLFVSFFEFLFENNGTKVLSIFYYAKKQMKNLNFHLP
jgi:hypothetical protein